MSNAAARELNPEFVQRVLQDTRLTADAARLVLHIYTKGAGRHEVPFLELSILIGHKTDKPVRATVNLAAHCGYLRWGKGGGGHHNWYEAIDSLGAGSGSDVAVSDQAPSQGTRVGADSESDTGRPAESEQTPSPGDSVGAGSGTAGPHARDDGVSSSPPSISPSPPGRARPKSLERLKGWLGPGAEAADALDRNGLEHRANWADHVWGAYCRPEEPTSPLAAKLSPEAMRAVVEAALSAYAVKGALFDPAHFDGYVRRAAVEHSRSQRLDPEQAAAAAEQRARERAEAAAANGRRAPPDEAAEDKRARQEREAIAAFFSEPGRAALLAEIERDAEAEADRRSFAPGKTRDGFVRGLVAKWAKERMREEGVAV